MAGALEQLKALVERMKRRWEIEPYAIELAALIPVLERQVQAAVEAEREACAVAVDAGYERYDKETDCREDDCGWLRGYRRGLEENLSRSQGARLSRQVRRREEK